MAGQTIARREVLGKLGEGAWRVAGNPRDTQADGLVAGVRLAFIFATNSVHAGSLRLEPNRTVLEKLLCESLPKLV